MPGAPPGQPRTALAAVFRRLASEAPAAWATAAAGPEEARWQLPGFVETVEPTIGDTVGFEPPPSVEPAAPEAEDPGQSAAPPADAPLESDLTEMIAGLAAAPEPTAPVAAPLAPAEPSAQLIETQNGSRSSDSPPDARAVEAPAPRSEPLTEHRSPEPAFAAAPAAPAPAPQRAVEPAIEHPPEAGTAGTPSDTALAPSGMPAGDRPGRAAMPRNRRLYRRVKLAAEIDIDGVPSTLIDLSIGGFAVSDAPAMAANTVVPIALRMTIDGIDVGVQLSARIIYATETRTSGRFVELTASQTAFLRYLVTWRGESVGVVGTTTLLDAITGGPDRAFTSAAPDHLGEPPRERWWSGWIGGRKITPPR